MMIQEKKHRLAPEAYRGYTRVSMTACLLDRSEYFVTAERFAIHEAHLLRALEQHRCVSEVYLFMPDHVHVIITGTAPDSDAYAAMTKFKQYSGFWLGRNEPLFNWQKDFYDHILREDDDLRTLMLYILNNPIRAGICDRWGNYNYKGSTVFDLRTW
jgi:putative transposase